MKPVGLIGLLLGTVGAGWKAAESYIAHDWVWAAIASISFLILLFVCTVLLRSKTA